MDTSMRPSDLDFVTFHEDYEVGEVVNHPILKQIINLLDRYQNLVDGNKSLARHRNPDPYALHWSTFEANLREEFHNRGPCLVADENEENIPAPSLNYVDISREAEDSDLILQDDGTYHYSYRGRLFRLSEHERGYIIRVRILLKPWPHPEDMKKENEAIEAVMEELEQYEKALMAAITRKKNIVTRLNERRGMISRYLESPSGPSDTSQPRNSPSVSRALVSRETSPANSIMQDTRGDIEYAVSSEDSSSTDQSSDEDMKMQDAHHERPKEPSMDILPEVLPATQQREETRETEVTLLNEPAPDSSPRGSGWSMDELLSSAAALYDSDGADSSSINRPVAQRRRRNPPIRQTEDEKKNGYKFVRDQQASKASWDQIILDYNRAFGVDRTKQSLTSLVDRWKTDNGDKKPSSASRRGTRTSQGSRTSRNWRKPLASSSQPQSSAVSSPRGARGSRDTIGSPNPGPNSTNTA